MTESLHPEAIRGVWFQINGEKDPEKARAKQTFDVMTFSLDGSYARATLKNGYRRQHESGDYTFDGEFLITRGRNTETYRVHAQAPWLWALEDRRNTVYITRAMVDPEAERPALDPDAARDLRIMPLRAKFKPFGQSEFEAYEIFYDTGGVSETPLPIGTLVVEYLEEDWTWVGIMPTRTGLTPEAWGRIAREGFLEFHRDVRLDPDHEVTVSVFDTGALLNA